MKLSEKIVTLRKQKGFSQEELAEKLNISRQAVSRWEMGTALPDATNILQLSKLFKVSTDYLLNDDYNSEQDIPAVKNQKEFILLVAMQAMCFVFHIITCFALTIPPFPILSIVLNTFFAAKLYREFDNYNIMSEIIRKYFIDVYIIIIWLMAYIPMMEIIRICLYMFGPAELPNFYFFVEITGALICIIPALLSIYFIKKKGKGD